MSLESKNEHVSSESEEPEEPEESDNAFDYRGTPQDKADFEALTAENVAEAAERSRKERAEEIQRIQEDFDRDTEKIRQERIRIEEKKEIAILREKVEKLKKEYVDEVALRNEYVNAERNRGFLRKAWEFLFVSRDASSPDRLNIVALNERVRQSLSLYRAAKKELEDRGVSISESEESPV